MRSASTRELTAAPLEVVVRARAHRLLTGAAIAVAAALAITAGLHRIDDAGLHQQVQQENAALHAELGRLRTELELATATRAALDRQVADLSEQAADLDRQLAFFRTRADRGTRSPRPAAEEHAR